MLRIEVGGKTYSFESGPVTIGRSPDCDVVVMGEGVSRQHVRVHQRGDGWSIDDESSHGIFSGGGKLDGPLGVGEGLTLSLGSASGPTVSVAVEAADTSVEKAGDEESSGNDNDSRETIEPIGFFRRLKTAKPLVVIGAVLPTVLLTVLFHIVNAAYYHEGLNEVAVGDVSPLPGNRLAGYVFVFFSSFLISGLLARLLGYGWSRTREDGARHLRSVLSLVKNASSIDKLLFLLMLPIGASLWAAAGLRVNAGWGVLVMMLGLVYMLSPRGDEPAQALGSVLPGKRMLKMLDEESTDVDRGRAVLIPVLVGIGVAAMLDAPLWLLAAIVVLIVLWRTPTPAIAGVALLGAIYIGLSSPAYADDGGWVEGGGNLGAWINSDGADDVIKDAGHSVLPSAAGGALGAAAAAALAGSSGGAGSQSPRKKGER